MHISKINGRYPVAFKPNNIILRTKDNCSALEHQLLMTLFVAPAASFPKDRTISIDVDLITDKPLKGSVYSRLNKAIENAFDARFEIITDSTHFELIHVFRKIKRDGNVITATIDQFAIDEIKKQLPCGFTKIPIEYTIKLTTAYQFVFLEYILKNNGTKTPAISIDDIKKRTNIPKNKYPRWTHFNQRVVCPSVSKLIRVLNLEIECKVVKSGKRVTSIIINENKKLKKSKSVGCVNNKTEDDSFNFALKCYEHLPLEEQEKYKKDLPACIGNTVALSTAVNNFYTQNSALLRKTTNIEEFIKLKTTAN
jgi:hypothetical protein